MAEITAKDVQTLREKTGCGMMDCKKALIETGGDMEKAIVFLREKGLAAADKKSGRTAAEGLVAIVADGLRKAAMIEVNSETDFVAKNEEFKKFVNDCARIVLDKNPADLDALMALPFGDSGMTVEAMLKEKILVIGEKLAIRRFIRLSGTVSNYVHGGGKIGVLVEFDTDAAGNDAFASVAKDVAMEVAAYSPKYVSREDVPEQVITREMEILKAQVVNEGKAEAVAEKIVKGRIGKFFSAVCLTELEYIRDEKLNVAQMISNAEKELGAKIKIKAFHRFEKGEGIEKRQDDFAGEVAGMIK